MKNIITIAKKELSRVLKNRRMLIALILPGVLIYVLYSLMGGAMQNQVTTDEEKAKADTYIVYAVNMPDVISDGISGLEYNFSYTAITGDEVEAKKELLKTGEADLILVFDENFASNVASGGKPLASAYYNPYITKSDYAYNRIYSVAVNAYKSSVIAGKFGDIEVFSSSASLVYDENKAAGSVMAMILPMIIIMLLFSGCMAVTPEAIAGEKERGTMATLLSTPVKRGEIAIGKISALSLLAAISAASSFIGLMLSLPALLGTSSLFSIYGVGDIILLFFILMSTVLVIVGAMALISSFSKNVKEATMIITPFMMLGMLVGILNMLIGVPGSFLFYLIPIYNASASVASVLSFEISVVNLAVTVVSNIAYVGLFAYLLTKAFNSEKIMFSK